MDLAASKEHTKVMSRAERRKLKRPQETVSVEVREQRKEQALELRRKMRKLKGNGWRRRLKREAAKREREEDGGDVDTDQHYQPKKKRKADPASANDVGSAVDAPTTSTLRKPVVKAPPKKRAPIVGKRSSAGTDSW